MALLLPRRPRSPRSTPRPRHRSGPRRRRGPGNCDRGVSRPGCRRARATDSPERAAARSRWARLLARIYEVFPLHCSNCGGHTRILAFLTDPERALELDQTPAFDPAETEPDVPDDALVLTEETFGPILPVVRVRNGDEAVRRANELPMGLFASVWTGDRKRGEAVARRLRVGGVSVNDTLSHWGVPSLPVGGVGESGYSRVRGDEGLREFTRARAFLVDRPGLGSEPWWFPYTPLSRRLMRGLVAWEGLSGFSRVTGFIREMTRREEEP